MECVGGWPLTHRCGGGSAVWWGWWRVENVGDDEGCVCGCKSYHLPPGFLQASHEPAPHLPSSVTEAPVIQVGCSGMAYTMGSSDCEGQRKGKGKKWWDGGRVVCSGMG